MLTGGEQFDRVGAFYPPTVLTDVPSGCPADTEETFGPVATVYEVADAEEAITVANDTRFGLGASLWTADRERGQRLAREVSAGCVYINEMTKSDPRVPFGGIKDAGYGRELSEMGIKEFVKQKDGLDRITGRVCHWMVFPLLTRSALVCRHQPTAASDSRDRTNLLVSRGIMRVHGISYTGRYW